ncbi:MAG: nucleotidyltransferase family protein [Pelomonas sp.]|nr:nucleotidyltransferase family protein [Roseateles sp.]
MLLIDVLREPARIRGLGPAQWDLLVRQARHANLLGRLHAILARADLLDAVLPAALVHLRSAAVLAERQHQSVRFETAKLRDTLAGLGTPLLLLKGAAYVAAGLPASLGRVFADVDILVPRARLSEAESALLLTGWIGAVHDAYDQRYYREWMHELPAMRHMERGTALDVHHTILPPTARLHPDPALLFEAAVALPDLPGVAVLAPTDMVLHSATHLFFDGEVDNLLRDLSDLDLLLRHFGAAPAFWLALVARARRLELTTPLRLALRHCRRVFATPIPAETFAAVAAERAVPLLDFVYARALRPPHASAADRFSRLAARLLYLRGHWQRMPPLQLARHLMHKALFPPRPQHVPLPRAADPGDAR